MFSFAVYCDEEDLLQPILADTELSVVSKDRFGVITGSLDKWSDAILWFCCEQSSFNLRLAFNKIVLLFEHANLQDIWMQYSKHRLPDKTFTLKRK